MSFEEYRKKHYQSQFAEAHEILSELFDLENPEKKDWFMRCFTVLLDKMWTPQVYLYQYWKKEQKRNNLPKSGGPGQGSDAPAKPPVSSSPQRRRQIISRKPTQIILPDEYADKVEVGPDYIQLLVYLPRADWNILADIAKQYGMKYVPNRQGKLGGWEKQ